MNPIGVTAVVTLLIALAVYPPYIGWLKRKQIGQFIREEGPQSHAVKARTPTMGGLAFIFITVVVAAAYMLLRQETIWVPFGSVHPQLHALGAPRPDTPTEVAVVSWPALAVLGVGAICGLIGFADDFGKITSKSNRGLSAKLRLLVEFGLGLVLAAILYVLGAAPHMLAGFGHGIHLNQTWQLIYLIAVVPFMVAATTNAINLHDGMDGLAAGTSVLVFSVLYFMTLTTGQPYLAVICACMAGALTGFLAYNRYPAKLFMGDTGSLYIGGIMAAVVAASGLALWFIPLALIYIAETLSVMAQVAYFKLTKPYTPEKPMSKPALIWLKLTKRLPGDGKRLFRMAPLHHHFEAVGAEHNEPEWKVVAYFWVVQFLLCAFTLLAFSKANPFG